MNSSNENSIFSEKQETFSSTLHSSLNYTFSAIKFAFNSFSKTPKPGSNAAALGAASVLPMMIFIIDQEKISMAVALGTTILSLSTAMMLGNTKFGNEDFKSTVLNIPANISKFLKTTPLPQDKELIKGM